MLSVYTTLPMTDYKVHECPQSTILYVLLTDGSYHYLPGCDECMKGNIQGLIPGGLRQWWILPKAIFDHYSSNPASKYTLNDDPSNDKIS